MKKILLFFILFLSFNCFLFSQDQHSILSIQPSTFTVVATWNEYGELVWWATDYEFTTDGCSMFPDGIWGECCLAHDIDYWMGGDKMQRFRSDVRLRECIQKTGEGLLTFKALSWLMWTGVRFGGYFWLPTPFRWGYGWKYPRAGP